MKQLIHLSKIACSTGLLLLLIFDSNTATAGAKEGIDICMKVIIPSLFPFFIITAYLNATLLGSSIPGVGRFCRLLKFPTGADSLFLLGLIGGYPIGAQLIADAYRSGKLSKRTGQILLGYCSNAGPAFIFGVAGALFSSVWISFLLWFIHILSALTVGFLLPKPEKTYVSLHPSSENSLISALNKSVKICASVCSWVIVFKVLMAYLGKWLVMVNGKYTFVSICGILELSNGCILLKDIPNSADCFIQCSIFLAFGGICVLLQTVSVTSSLGLGSYLPGKLMQTSISLLLSYFLSGFLFSQKTEIPLRYILISVLIFLVSLKYAEKRYGNSCEFPV